MNSPSGALAPRLVRLLLAGAVLLLCIPPAVTAAPLPAAQSSTAGTPDAGGFDPSRYTPAILRLSFSRPGSRSGADPTAPASSTDSFLDLTLLPLQGDPIGKRVEISSAEFNTLLRSLYAQISRQEDLDVGNPQSPARQLDRFLIEPLAADLQRLGVTTLLIAADPGLQAVPLAALHDGRQFFGERYAFSITPALGLTALGIPSSTAQSRLLGAGASRFDGLAPLPLVPQELSKVSPGQSDTYLDKAFTPSVLVDRIADPAVTRVHVATHAEFLPGGPDKAKLFTGTQPFSLSSFASLRQRRNGQLLDLITLSACRTALGDKDSELGFAGLALQAGSRSAIGTLWYVDDVATSAFFVQFYRYLEAGLPKAEALQSTRIAMAQGRIRLQGDRVVGPDGTTLLDGLNSAQKLRVREGLTNPFFWAGITLLGTPW